MPQDGCCCISRTFNNCFARRNWDQSFLDEDFSGHPSFFRAGHGPQLIERGGGMSRPAKSNCYESEPKKRYKLPAKIPTDLTDWDPIKISNNDPKNDAREKHAVPSTTDDRTDGVSSTASPAHSNLSDLCALEKLKDEEEAARIRNSLATVVRRACPRKLLDSISGTPPPSPREPPLTSPRSLVVNVNDFDGSSQCLTASLNINSPKVVGSELRLPRELLSVSSSSSASLEDSSPPFIPPRLRTPRSPLNRMYQNTNAQFFRDVEVFEPEQNSSATLLPSESRTSGDTSEQSASASINFDRRGISHHNENISLHPRKISSTSAAGVDSGVSVSSAGSDVLTSESQLLASLNSEHLLANNCGSVTSHVDVPEICVSDIHDSSNIVNINARKTSRSSISSSTSRMASPNPDVQTLELTSMTDVDRLEIVRARVAVCGFYMGQMSSSEAEILLAPTPVGTYILRDSSDPRFVYAISVQTTRGPTSIRIGYESGCFHLDSDPHQMDAIPKFSCVLALVQFYVRLNSAQGLRSSTGRKFVLVETSKRRDSPVVLLKPYGRSGPAALMHLCRKTINGQLDGRSTNRLCLIPSLKSFLNDYPYDL